MAWTAPFASTVIISACGPSTPSLVAENSSNVGAARQTGVQTTVSSGAAIIGHWRIAGAGERAVDQPEAITASITGDTLHLAAGCVHLAWAIALSDGRVKFTRVPVEGCARGLTSIEVAVADAISSADRAYRTPANALVFAGPRGDVTLFTQ